MRAEGCLARPYRSEPVNPMNGATSARLKSPADVARRGCGWESPRKRRAGWQRAAPRLLPQVGGNRRARPASSVLKFDIAILFNRHLLERLHRAFEQRHVVGIARLAVQTAARGLGAGDALLLHADLATRQIFKGRRRNVGRRGIVEMTGARAGERGESGSNVWAKAHDVIT